MGVKIFDGTLDDLGGGVMKENTDQEQALEDAVALKREEEKHTHTRTTSVSYKTPPPRNAQKTCEPRTATHALGTRGIAQQCVASAAGDGARVRWPPRAAHRHGLRPSFVVKSKQQTSSSPSSREESKNHNYERIEIMDGT